MLIQYLMVFFSIIKIIYSISTPQDDYYIAAVTEYYCNENMEENLPKYLKDIEKAAILGADIIVMPEDCLMSDFNYIPVPIHGLLKEYPVPALNPHLYDEVLVAISKAARNHSIYVILNVAEELNCIQNNSKEYCPEGKIYHFNTNVVFDRNGNVIDRYRKINLFDEEEKTPALIPEIGIFETDFGVTFGHFICFDLVSQIPAMKIVQKYNITDIAVPSMWYSELPFLTVIQVYHEYANTMNVNLLSASGLHNETGGGLSNGSIYSGKAGEISKLEINKHSRFNIAKVPKVPGMVNREDVEERRANPKNVDGLALLSDQSLPYHVNQKLHNGEQKFILKSGDVTCHFNITMNLGVGEKRYEYRAGVYSGVRSIYGFATHGLRDCAVFACLNDSIHSCGKRFSKYTPDSAAYFSNLHIVGIVPKTAIDHETHLDDSTFSPTAITLALEPLKTGDYEHFVKIEDNIAIHNLQLNNHKVELLSFSLRGRVYKRDGEVSTDVNIEN